MNRFELIIWKNGLNVLDQTNEEGKMEKIRTCTKCGCTSDKYPWRTNKGKKVGNVCLGCVNNRKYKNYVRNKILRKNGEYAKEHFVKMKNTDIDEIALECERLGISYGQYQAMKYSGKMKENE